MLPGFKISKSFLVITFIMTLFLGLHYSHASDPAPSAAPAATSAAPEKKELEWPKVQAEVASLKAKIHQSEEAIKKFNEDRLKAKDEKVRAEIHQSMKDEHQNLKQLVKEYEERRNYFLYRFPEKGRTAAREYQRIEVKSLEEMENQHSLEARVTKAVKTMRGKFKVEGSQQREEKKDQNKTDLSAPIIISK